MIEDRFEKKRRMEGRHSDQGRGATCAGIEERYDSRSRPEKTEECNWGRGGEDVYAWRVRSGDKKGRVFFGGGG